VEGLIDVRHGQGMTLIRSIDDVVPPIDADILRAHPQVAAAGEVATRSRRSPPSWRRRGATADDLEAMVAGVREMDAEIRSGAPGLGGDRTFHAAILAAARNDVLTELLGAVAEHSRGSPKHHLRDPGNPHDRSRHIG